ncbi:hypothetical protein [Frigidibacter sp. ROC022]|uniref:hypothetical protein n=1 Tax=Frigidibacter sp. ROC022 TaxID=2971796 RepID=UPI00215B478E|nr:hypothetical protein [Frigidibacter sp. ROC022]MCR8725540.1 hypothetical protein [Frigidibacter sp. ROC022]
MDTSIRASGPVRQVMLRRGRDLIPGAAMARGPVETRAVDSVALLARDYPGLTLDPQVTVGERVVAGQAICRDRHHAEIVLTSPVAGTVAHVLRGRRRRLETLVISVEEDGAAQPALTFDHGSAASEAQALRDLLLQSGAWAGFRARPFGRVPDPQARPAAILVSATETSPWGADPVAVLAGQLDRFQRGLAALPRLTGGPVYLCQPPAADFADPAPGLVVVEVSGPHPSGQPGPQIHHLHPATPEHPVWQIGYQEVLAIGHLLETGRVSGQRMVSLSGPDLAEPRLVRAPLGAELADLTRGLREDGDPRPLSGSILDGRDQDYLGRHDLQVTLPGPATKGAPLPPLWQRLLARLPRPAPGSAALLPMETFESVFPFDILPVPLMRALAVGDVESAERLGCLELLEEDMALLSWHCVSGSDYGALLRRMLDRLAEEAGT